MCLQKTAILNKFIQNNRHSIWAATCLLNYVFQKTAILNEFTQNSRHGIWAAMCLQIIQQKIAIRKKLDL